MMESRLNMVDFARNLARRGLREDALLILELLPDPPTIETLDLRARLLVQLGRYAEAEDCWQQVQAQSPDHAGASEGLATVADLRRSPLRRLRVALALRFCRVAGTCLALLLIVAFALGAELIRRQFSGLRQSQETLSSRLADREGAVDVVLGKLRQDAADLANLQLRTGDALAAIKADQDAMRKEVTTGLGKSTATMQKEIAAIKAGTKAEADQLRSAQDAAFQAASEQIAALAKQQQTTSTGVAKLAETSGSSGAALGKTISGLTGELTKLKATLAEVGKSNGAQSAAIAETKTQLLAQTEALAKQLATVVAADPTQRLADLSAQYLQLRASLSTQTKRTEELTAQLKGLGEKIAALGQAPAPAAPVPTPASSAPAAAGLTPSTGGLP